MEHAGQRVVEAMESAFDDLGARRVAVLCGRGNNGGDGFVVARLLRGRGLDPTVFLLAAPDAVRGDARTNLDILGRIGARVLAVPDSAAWARHRSDIAAYDLIVDAVLGTGLGRPLEGMLRGVVDDVNAAPAPTVAVDLPSGLSATATGRSARRCGPRSRSPSGLRRFRSCCRPAMRARGAGGRRYRDTRRRHR